MYGNDLTAQITTTILSSLNDKSRHQQAKRSNPVVVSIFSIHLFLIPKL